MTTPSPTASPSQASLPALMQQARALGLSGSEEAGIVTRADLLNWLANRLAPTPQPAPVPAAEDDTGVTDWGESVGLGFAFAVIGLCILWKVGWWVYGCLTKAERQHARQPEGAYGPVESPAPSPLDAPVEPPTDGSEPFPSGGLRSRRQALPEQPLYQHQLLGAVVAERSKQLRGDQIVHAGCCDSCRIWFERNVIFPLKRASSPYSESLRRIQSRYGTSVLPFYTLTAWVAAANFGVLVLWVMFAFVPWSWNGTTSWADVAYNLVGVDNGRNTDGSFWFYSGYPAEIVASGNQYNMATAYTYLCIVTFGIVYVACVNEMGDGVRAVPAEGATELTKQLQLVIKAYSWDWGVRDGEAVDNLMAGTWLDLRATHEQEEKAAMPVQWAKRLLGVLLSVVVCGGAVTVLYFLLINKDTLDATFYYSSSLCIAAVNAGVPFTQRQVIPLLQIAKPKMRVQVETLVIFVSRMVNVLFILGEVSRIEDDRSAGATVTVPPGGATITPVDVPCPEFFIGLYMQQLLLVDFVSGALMSYFGAWGTKAVMGKPDFQVATQVLGTLYRQCLTWMALVYAPGVLGISAVGHFMMFLVNRAAMFRFCRTPEQPGTDQGSSFFFQALLLAALIVALVPFVFFIMKRVTCGPHRGGLPTDPVTDALGVAEIDRGPLGPGIWVPMSIALATVLYVLAAAYVSAKKRARIQLRETRREILDLRSRCKGMFESHQNMHRQLRALQSDVTGSGSSSPAPRGGSPIRSQATTASPYPLAPQNTLQGSSAGAADRDVSPGSR
eukprot:TRINITY_DN26184_c0_g1_i1.p1 TRINITY_DN26184_c0_g1~~TRINITY_DN26184_c0_g1_i1.p1  ORF type:complete len:783 (+),score=274.35 TRINITY_DN26184_c0_g1_i1:69-2417(+)